MRRSRNTFPRKTALYTLKTTVALQIMTDFVMLRAYTKELDGKGTHLRELLVQSESCTDTLSDI